MGGAGTGGGHGLRLSLQGAGLVISGWFRVWESCSLGRIGRADQDKLGG
jgi:hypothetical protein